LRGARDTLCVRVRACIPRRDALTPVVLMGYLNGQIRGPLRSRRPQPGRHRRRVAGRPAARRAARYPRRLRRSGLALFRWPLEYARRPLAAVLCGNPTAISITRQLCRGDWCRTGTLATGACASCAAWADRLRAGFGIHRYHQRPRKAEPKHADGVVVGSAWLATGRQRGTPPMPLPRRRLPASAAAALALDEPAPLRTG
jgi:hypothetical protein